LEFNTLYPLGELSEGTSSSSDENFAVTSSEKCKKVRRAETSSPLLTEQSRFNNILEKLLGNMAANMAASQASPEEVELNRQIRIAELKQKLRILQQQDAL